MKREIAGATRGLLLFAGCAALGGWVSVALAAAPVANSYAAMTCEQLSSEYDRLNRTLMSDGVGAGAGAAEGVASATQCMPGVGLGSGDATARGLERAIMTADVLQRIGAVKAVHQTKSCTTRLVMSKEAAVALAEEKSSGEQDYKSSCAQCHGTAGTGNGWFGKYLSQRPPALSQIRKKNGGVFPSDHLYDVIDGRKELEMHGPRDMPVWGGVYLSRVDKRREPYAGQISSSDQLVRIRIRALVNHIEQFQE